MSIVKAELDGLLPIIIGVFWVIAQVVGNAAKKKNKARTNPFTTPTEKPKTEDPFADLMQKLSGTPEFKMPKPPEPVVQKPEPITRQPARPAPAPVTKAPEPEVPVTVDIRAFKTTMPSMKLPAMNLSFQTSENSSKNYPNLGKIVDPKDRNSLRRAILGHIILGKPKGLESWNCGAMD